MLPLIFLLLIKYMIKSFLLKYKKQLLYLFFGVLTTAVNIGVAAALYYAAGLGTAVSDAVAELCAVTFAYFTNKTLVFGFKSSGKKAARAAIIFYVGRLLGAFLGVAAMKISVDLCGLNFVACKIAVTAVLIIVNYFFSEYVVFRSVRKGVTAKKDTQKVKTEVD